jgi:hypothetical protein
MKPRQETKHSPLAKEGAQPLVRSYHDYVIKERQHFRSRLAKAIGITGVEVCGPIMITSSRNGSISGLDWQKQLV